MDQTIKIKRKVLMLQWEETRHESDGRYTYSYDKVWRDVRLDSSGFNDPHQHQNPREFVVCPDNF